MRTDSLLYDSVKVARYQANSAYDYSSRLESPDFSLLTYLERLFNRLLNRIFSGSFEENVTTPIMIGVFLVAAVVIVWFLYKKHPELFVRTGKNVTLPYGEEEENIHLIDFENDITSALSNSDYRLAIRLKYLQTLRFLSDNNLIDWQLHKTPTEYAVELRKRELRPVFRQLTNLFLEVRYGNRTATSALYDDACSYQAKIRTVTMEGGGEA
jgi:hypothetical protein